MSNNEPKVDCGPEILDQEVDFVAELDQLDAEYLALQRSDNLEAKSQLIHNRQKYGELVDKIREGAVVTIKVAPSREISLYPIGLRRAAPPLNGGDEFVGRKIVEGTPQSALALVEDKQLKTMAVLEKFNYLAEYTIIGVE